MNKHFLEKVQIVSGFVPVDMKTGANNGDYVSMKNYGRCAIVLHKGVGGAGEDPTIVLQQATSVAGTSVKALPYDRVDYKIGTLTAQGTFTTAAPSAAAAAAGTYTLSGVGTVEAIIVFDIKAEDLDIDNGFDCIRATIADVGTTVQVGSLEYHLHEPRNASATLPSAIAD